VSNERERKRGEGSTSAHPAAQHCKANQADAAAVVAGELAHNLGVVGGTQRQLLGKPEDKKDFGQPNLSSKTENP
jgi:hypothetical protein